MSDVAELTEAANVAKSNPSYARVVRRMLRANLAELALPAVRIGYEVGGPICAVLANEIRRTADIAIIANLYNHLHNGFPELSGLPQLPAGNAEFGTIPVAVGQRALDVALAQPDLDALRRRGVAIFTNLAGWHAITGQKYSARKVALKAVKFVEEGGASDDIELRAAYAQSLDILGGTLRPLGLQKQADKAARKGIQLYRELVAVDPAKYGPDLARSLVNWAGNLPRTEVNERVAAYNEAASLYRATTGHPDRSFLPDLCQTLIGLANILLSTDNVKQAVEIAWEAQKIAYELVSNHDRSYRSLLAMAETNLALSLQKDGQTGAAIKHFKVAVKIGYALLAESRKAHIEPLVQSLSALALSQIEDKQLQSAFDSLKEAADLCSSEGGQFIHNHVLLASTLLNFGIVAFETEHYAHVFPAVEAARIQYNKLSQRNPDNYASQFATLIELEEKARAALKT